MNVSVVVPWRGGCPHRERAWRFVRCWYGANFPDFELVVGEADSDRWRKADAILDGARRCSGDVIVVADADVITSLTPAIANVDRSGWAIPHLRVIRLDEAGTERFMAGERDEANLTTVSGALGPGKHQGREGGGVVVIRRELLFDVPPDRRFVGWGQEDDSWALALKVLAGKPWRDSADLWHLYHPPQERLNRAWGSEAGRALWERYHAARHSREAMRALIDEAREA